MCSASDMLFMEVAFIPFLWKQPEAVRIIFLLNTRGSIISCFRLDKYHGILQKLVCSIPFFFCHLHGPDKRLNFFEHAFRFVHIP